MADDRKKYNGMEKVLNKINGDFISMSEKDIKRNNEILNSIVNQITTKMEEKDNLFNTMFTGIFFGGSYYDGLKVGEPDEYDLDLLLQIPSSLKYEIRVASNVPGFVLLPFSEYKPSLKKLDLAVKYKNVSQQMRKANTHQDVYFRRRTLKNTVSLCYAEETRGFDKLVNSNNYLEKSKVLSWIQGVVDLALNTFGRDSYGRRYIRTPHGNFSVKIAKAGPAFTLKANGIVSNREVKMDIDLVPCFEFSQNEWPQGHFRPNPVPSIKPTFFIVPKEIKGMSNSDHYWRLSFQAQERVLMDGKHKLKPTIKLLKKMRDMLQHQTIASYYIKTVALWTIKEKDPNFWNSNSLSCTFMTVLKNYQKSLENGKILYFWNDKFDLLGRVNDSTIYNVKNRITAVINDIERHPEDPFVVAKYLVTPAELLQLKYNMAHS